MKRRNRKPKSQTRVTRSSILIKSSFPVRYAHPIYPRRGNSNRALCLPRSLPPPISPSSSFFFSPTPSPRRVGEGGEGRPFKTYETFFYGRAQSRDPVTSSQMDRRNQERLLLGSDSPLPAPPATLLRIPCTLCRPNCRFAVYAKPRKRDFNAYSKFSFSRFPLKCTRTAKSIECRSRVIPCNSKKKKKKVKTGNFFVRNLSILFLQNLYLYRIFFNINITKFGTSSAFLGFRRIGKIQINAVSMRKIFFT